LLTSLAAAALALGQDRLDLREIEKAAMDPTGLTARFSVTMGETAQVAFFRSGDERQRIEVRGDKSHEEFVQTSQGMIYINHLDRRYEEFMTPGRLTAMPPRASVLATYALSPWLHHDWFRSTVSGKTWKRIDPNRGLWRLDPEGGERLEVDVDAPGAFRAVRTMETPGGSFEVRLAFTVFESGEPQADFSVDPPIGYVPYSVDPPVVQLGPGDALKLEGLKSAAPTGLGSRRALILFTRPDCVPSQAGAALWNRLGNQCQAFDASFVEVSVGPKPGRTGSFHDRQSDLARAFLLTETPALFALEANRIVATWYGFRPGEEQAALDTLLSRWRRSQQD
jgi:hypothetical protein